MITQKKQTKLSKLLLKISKNALPFQNTLKKQKVLSTKRYQNMSTKERLNQLTEILYCIPLEEYATLNKEIKELLNVIESNDMLLT